MKMGRGSAPTTHPNHLSDVPTYPPQWRTPCIAPPLASVAIEGCVTAGENDDTYVLAAVREIPGLIRLDVDKITAVRACGT